MKNIHSFSVNSPTIQQKLMGKELILQNLKKHILLNPTEEAYFINLLTEKTIKRKQFLLHENEIATHVAFIVKGCLRSYSIDKNGFEHIVQFAPCDWWISDMGSFISQKKSLLNIDAIEDTELLLLSRKDHLILFDKVPKFERFFRIILENALASTQRRLLDNLSLTAEERYLAFCTLYPTLKNNLPQKYIAAYIGVTPEFLSKMKAELLKKAVRKK
jgi:CRP-like cAMP-binding protein